MENYSHLLDPARITLEERLDALADVLAEGLLYLDQNGLLNSEEDSYPSQAPSEKILQEATQSAAFQEQQGSGTSSLKARSHSRPLGWVA